MVPWLKRGNGFRFRSSNSVCAVGRMGVGIHGQHFRSKNVLFQARNEQLSQVTAKSEDPCSSAQSNNQLAAQESASGGSIAEEDGTMSHRTPGGLARGGGNTVFQSCFIATTIQPLRVASSRALLSVPT